MCRSRTPLGIVSTVMRGLSVAHFSEDPQVEETLIQLSGFVSKGTPIYVVSSREMPQVLNPETSTDQDATTTGDRESDRLGRQLRQTLTLIRWLNVESEDFEKMFTPGRDLDSDAGLRKLSSKWAVHAQR